MLAAAIFNADRYGWWRHRCLILTEVGNLRGLKPGDRVLYRGAEIGYVEGFRPAPADKKFSLRLRVKCSAFRQIALDAVVRIEPQGTNQPYVVNILPGRDPAPEDYPGKVKVLNEASTMDLFWRGVREVLEGVLELSKEKRMEAELERLRAEEEKLRPQGEQAEPR